MTNGRVLAACALLGTVAFAEAPAHEHGAGKQAQGMRDGAAGPSIRVPWARASRGRTSAVYFSVIGGGNRDDRLIAAAVERFGKLDILVNNAGIGDAPGRGKAVWELADGEWLDGIAVNLHGTFWCTRAALARMRPRGEGAILNVASGMGMRATPQSPAYAAAKAGVISLTQSVAAAVARDGVRVNCITPGLVAQSPPATEDEAEAIRQRGRFITARRLGEAWELGPLALFLCSDAAAYVTGANYCIDGGGLAGGVAPTGWDPANG